MEKKGQTRREFLRASAGTVMAAPYVLSGCRTRRSRPNILFCISDDQSYPHASIYGSPFVRTPGFDRVAEQGVVFTNAFVSCPSCCPSRGSVLTGQDFYRLREASMNHTIWPRDIPVYPDLLAEAGYAIGYTGKGWGPGNWQVSGRKYNPAGPAFNDIKTKPPGEYISNVDYAANFEAFLRQKPAEAPFCFWVGFQEPHRPYEQGIGVRHGKKIEDVEVPGYLPDVDVVRSDLADYAFEIEYYDSHLQKILELLEQRGELQNTLIVVTSDNGMPFPRAKATLYDSGARMPLAICWPERIKGGRKSEALVSFIDFAPTFLEAAGVGIPEAVTGKSLLALLEGRTEQHREFVVFGIERHFPGSRPGGAGYPCRAIRTPEYLYIHNLRPELSPMGDHPGPAWPRNDAVKGFGDTDGGPTKTFLWENREKYKRLFELAFGKRPAEELYDVQKDPYQLSNIAGQNESLRKELASQLESYLKQTEDPRAIGRGEELDEVMKRFPGVGSNG